MTHTIRSGLTAWAMAAALALIAMGLTAPPAEAAIKKGSYVCAQICKYATSALWWDINGSYRIVESIRHRGGTANCGADPSQIDEWFVSGSDVRRSSNDAIQWWVDRLPVSSNLTNCDPFDPGGLIAANPNVGRIYALEVPIKWDYIDHGNPSFNFTIFDCWFLNTGQPVNALHTSTC